MCKVGRKLDGGYDDHVHGILDRDHGHRMSTPFGPAHVRPSK